MPDPHDRGDRRAALGVFALALAVRLVPVVMMGEATLYSDSGEYHQIARTIVATGDYVPSAYRPPLYPYLLALVMVLFGDSTRLIMAVHALLGALTALLTMILAAPCGRGPARAAGLIVALYPTLILYVTLVLSENLYFPLFLLAVLALRWLECGGGWLAALLAGALSGLAALARSSALLMAPLLAGLVGPPGYGRRVLRAGAALLAAAAILAPWSYRNYRLLDALVPIDTNTGFNLMVGNNPRATGQLRLDVLKQLEHDHLAGRDELERHRQGLKVAGDFILGQPLQFLALVPRKLGFLFGLEGRELLWAYSHEYFGAVRAWLLMLCVAGVIAGFPLLALAALLGLLLRPDRLVLGVLLYTMAVHSIAFGESRFHLPLVPLLAISAAWAWRALARRGWNCVRELPRSRRLLLAAVALALIARWSAELIGYWPRLALLLAPGGHRAYFPY